MESMKCCSPSCLVTVNEEFAEQALLVLDVYGFLWKEREADVKKNKVNDIANLSEQ